MRAAPFVLVLVALALAGCAKEAPAAQEEKLRLAPTGYRTAFFEKDLNLTQGQRVTLSFRAAEDVTWDVHTHVGDRVEVVAEGRGASATEEIVAAHDGVYSLSFLNTLDKPVDLTYTLSGP